MRNKFISRIVFITIPLIIFGLSVSAQTKTNSTGLTGGLNTFMLAVLGFLFLALVGVVYFIFQNKKYQKEYELKHGAAEKGGLMKWWNELDSKFFTKAAPLEKEADVLLDHDYDGIKELDNALPPWWKWGFYITIIVAVFYMYRFHVSKTGPDPEEEYNKEMTAASAQLEKMRKSSKEMIDEKTVTMADKAGIEAGKKIFSGVCFACHGANGEGNAVGPNLTDKYWLHGGSLGDVFKTINVGVPDKGMQAWGKTYSPTDMKNMASFILSLQGTNPANAKAPQGDLYDPAKVPAASVADTTAAKTVK